MTSASLAGDFRPNDAERRLDALVAEHFDFVWRVARRLGASAADADDVVQEVFLVAARRLGAIEAGRERAFLIGVAMRVFSSERRRVRRRREEPEALTDQLVAAAGDPLQSLELSQARLLLAEVLADLPLDLRAVLILYELEQLSDRCVIPRLRHQWPDRLVKDGQIGSPYRHGVGQLELAAIHGIHDRDRDP